MKAAESSVTTQYSSVLDPRETEQAIKLVKDFFEINLAEALNLKHVTAPLIVPAGTGINDDLNGLEKPVRFMVKSMGDTQAEVVQSLAKWKRLALADLGIYPGEGIYTDMNALRPDETLDHLHSIYVDQWDWERIISPTDRNLEFLKTIVRRIYRVLRRTELHIHQHYPEIVPCLPEEITFIHAEELEARYPHVYPRAREDRAAEKHGAIFVIGIGAPLADGNPHDGRAPDYDDWITPNGKGRGLNGDLIVHYPLLGRAMELSSMGIRVVAESLTEQLHLRDCPERAGLYYHRRLLAGELPCSIGGGIGQSRLCMFFLRKAHIGEVQAGIWPEVMRRSCADQGVNLL